MRLTSTRRSFRPCYYLDFRTEATRDFKSDNSDYTDSRGAVWIAENTGAAGATFGIGASGLTIVGTGSTNVTGSTRTAPILRVEASDLGIQGNFELLHVVMDVSVTTPSSNTGGIVIWEAASGNNNSRNYIGDSSGTKKMTTQVTIGGTQTAVGEYAPGTHHSTIRLESLVGMGGDMDWYGDFGTDAGGPDLASLLAGRLTSMHSLSTGPIGWDQGGVFAPGSTGRLLFSTANTGTIVVRRIWVSRMDFSVG